MAIHVRVSGSQDLSADALVLQTAHKGRGILNYVTLKASENITETVQVILRSALGAAYDVVLDSTNLSAAQNYVFMPDGSIVLEPGDKIELACSNGNTTGIVYGTISLEDLGRI